MEPFRTPVSIEESKIKIHYGSNLMLMGSCFSEHIGKNLSDSKFLVDNNPFGIVYNPMSIKQGITRLLEGNEYLTGELVQNQDVWFSFDHHGKFSDVDKNNCLSAINHQFQRSAQNLVKANFLFITFGTAYVYRLLSTGKIVANCHKVSAKEFERKRVSVEEITEEYLSVITRLRQVNPSVFIVFTVSPVRHWKDGAHENQLSKSILHLATERICNSCENTFYFPSYELLMDDLRDYRFYADDMFHPGSLAIHYIWEKFTDCFMDSKTRLIMSAVEKIVSARKHRPFNPESNQYKIFANQSLEQIRQLQDQYQILLPDEEKFFSSQV
jgi:hypothetical protein